MAVNDHLVAGDPRWIVHAADGRAVRFKPGVLKNHVSVGEVADQFIHLPVARQGADPRRLGVRQQFAGRRIDGQRVREHLGGDVEARREAATVDIENRVELGAGEALDGLIDTTQSRRSGQQRHLSADVERLGEVRDGFEQRDAHHRRVGLAAPRLTVGDFGWAEATFGLLATPPIRCVDRRIVDDQTGVDPCFGHGIATLTAGTPHSEASTTHTIRACASRQNHNAQPNPSTATPMIRAMMKTIRMAA